MDVRFIKHAQYLNPLKQSKSGTANVIVNFPLRAGKVSPQCFAKLLLVPSSDSQEGVCDRVRNQWMIYEIEEIPPDYYMKTADITVSPCKVSSCS